MHRIARIVLGIISPLVLLACFVGGMGGILVFVVVTPLVPVALIALGMPRRGGGRRVAWVLLVLALSLEVGSVGILLSSGSAGESSSIAGLPPAAVLMFIALGVVPLLLIPVCYAALFEASREP